MTAHLDKLVVSEMVDVSDADRSDRAGKRMAGLVGGSDKTLSWAYDNFSPVAEVRFAWLCSSCAPARDVLATDLE